MKSKIKIWYSGLDNEVNFKIFYEFYLNRYITNNTLIKKSR